MTQESSTSTVPYDVAEQLRSTDEVMAYFYAWLEDTPRDEVGMARAIFDLTRALLQMREPTAG